MASSPITSWPIQGGNMEAMKIYFSWAPKSLWKMTAVMKLKDACSLEGRLLSTFQKRDINLFKKKKNKTPKIYTMFFFQ